jgi:hypothetical protein
MTRAQLERWIPRLIIIAAAALLLAVGSLIMALISR